MNNNPPHRATPRHCAILAASLLFLIAALTGSAHLLAVRAIGVFVLFPL